MKSTICRQPVRIRAFGWLFLASGVSGVVAVLGGVSAVVLVISALQVALGARLALSSVSISDRHVEIKNGFRVRTLRVEQCCAFERKAVGGPVNNGTVLRLTDNRRIVCWANDQPVIFSRRPNDVLDQITAMNEALAAVK